jgi:hypothetical protein
MRVQVWEAALCGRSILSQTRMGFYRTRLKELAAKSSERAIRKHSSDEEKHDPQIRVLSRAVHQLSIARTSRVD